MIKLMIFDLDGTIADTPESMCHSLNICLKKFHLKELPVENFKFYAGDGARTMVERALADAGNPDLSLFEPVYEMYKEVFAEGCVYHVTSFDGLRETLCSIRDKGIQMAVCTNKAQENAEKVVRSVYADEFFTMIAGHCDAYPKKPDPASVYEILKHYDVSKEETLYIGDTNTDMMTGKNAGLFCIGVTWGFRDRNELESTGADVIIDHPSELLKFIG